MNERTPHILVVGGGVSGFSAAISAAENGCRVTLIEKEKSLGGNAVQSNVGTICGAFYRNLAKPFLSINHPFLHYFLSAQPKEPIHYHNGLVVVPYQAEQLDNWMKTELKRKGIAVCLQAEIVQMASKNKHVSEVTFKDNIGKKVVIKPTAVIDCSGNASVSTLLGLETISSKKYQQASQVFRVKNISSESEYALNFALKKSMTQAAKAQNLPIDFVSLSAIPGSFQAPNVDLKFTLPEPITDAISQKTLNEKGELYTHQILQELKNSLPSFAKAELVKIYPQAGIRVQKRSLGQTILTDLDVLGAKKHPQSVARGTWPIEVWEANGKVSMTYFPENDFYDIPEGCLISNQLENLFFAGKNISASDGAIASARVIGTCLQTGHAAGKLASKIPVKI